MGRVVGVHGIRGWIKVESYSEPRSRLVEYRPWILSRDSIETIFEIERAEAQATPLRVKLRGIDERETALGLVGSEILMPRAALPVLGDDGFYWTDLEGLEVVTATGESLGTIAHLFATGANDVMVVRGDRERLIPFTPGHVVVLVDLAQRRIEVDWDADF